MSKHPLWTFGTLFNKFDIFEMKKQALYQNNPYKHLWTLLTNFKIYEMKKQPLFQKHPL